MVQIFLMKNKKKLVDLCTVFKAVIPFYKTVSIP